MKSCVLCNREFWRNGVCQLSADERFCEECAVKACENVLNKLHSGHCIDYGLKMPCTFGQCEKAKEQGIKRKEDCPDFVKGDE